MLRSVSWNSLCLHVDNEFLHVVDLDGVTSCLVTEAPLLIGCLVINELWSNTDWAFLENRIKGCWQFSRDLCWLPRTTPRQFYSLLCLDCWWKQPVVPSEQKQNSHVKTSYKGLGNYLLSSYVIRTLGWNPFSITKFPTVEVIWFVWYTPKS